MYIGGLAYQMSGFHKDRYHDAWRQQANVAIFDVFARSCLNDIKIKNSTVTSSANYDYPRRNEHKFVFKRNNNIIVVCKCSKKTLCFSNFKWAINTTDNVFVMFQEHWLWNFLSQDHTHTRPGPWVRVVSGRYSSSCLGTLGTSYCCAKKSSSFLTEQTSTSIDYLASSRVNTKQNVLPLLC